MSSFYDGRVMVSSISAEEALARLDPEERTWVEAFRDRVRRELGERLRDLRLYGSKARGDWHEESDIDLLVLVEGLDEEARDQIWVIAHDISPWLMPVVADFDRYHRPVSRATGFYKEMRKESVRL